MSKPLDLETQRPYALDQLTQLQSQIMQSAQGMVVQRARIEKYRQSDLAAARDTYTELEQIRRNLTEQIMLLCSTVVDGSDPELLAHTVWNILIQEGAPIPDCGIYYASLGRASASEQERSEIMQNLDQYALCMVSFGQEAIKDA